MRTSHQCCIMRKAMSKEVGAGGRLTFFWTLNKYRIDCPRIDLSTVLA